MAKHWKRADTARGRNAVRQVRRAPDDRVERLADRFPIARKIHFDAAAWQSHERDAVARIERVERLLRAFQRDALVGGPDVLVIERKD